MSERPREKEEPAVRETNEAVDCHLRDMLQQLHSVNASKPSERGLVRQEEAEDPACIPISGSASGWTIQTSTALGTSCATTVWGALQRLDTPDPLQ